MEEKIHKSVDFDSRIIIRLKEFINKKIMNEGRKGNKLYVHVDMAMREYVERNVVKKTNNIIFDNRTTYTFFTKTLDMFMVFIGKENFQKHLNIAIDEYLKKHDLPGRFDGK